MLHMLACWSQPVIGLSLICLEGPVIMYTGWQHALQVLHILSEYVLDPSLARIWMKFHTGR